MQLFYEDLSSAYDQNLRAVLGFLDIPDVDLPDVVPPLQRLADETSVMGAAIPGSKAVRYHHEAVRAELMTDGPPYADVVVEDFMPLTVALEMRATAEMHLGIRTTFNENTCELGLLVRAGLYTYLRTSRRCSALD